ncbi:hypothetical protein KR222_000453 [Zaprionus bogoriensis]|nr:hypothetical protein KR222_000453 [Zaprionus bogoriensis]
MSAERKCPLVISVAVTEDQLVQKLSDVLRQSAEQALKTGKTFRLGLSGGSLVQLLTRSLASHPLDTKGWRFFFCDERYVPDEDKESTYWTYKTQLLSQVPGISESQFVKANTALELDACAADYEARIIAEFGTSSPEFDLLLLGMGPDGHTCSLFPEQPESLAESQRLIIPIRNSPKPPPERITFTLPLLNNARQVAFVVTGAAKSSVVKRVFVDLDKQFPSAWIKPKHGQLTLIADEGAGKELGEPACCLSCK